MAYACLSEAVSFFLWHLTWGWRQLFLHTLFLWFFLVVVIPLGWMRSFFYSLFLHVLTSAWVCTLIAYLMFYWCRAAIPDLEQYTVVYTELHRVTLSFALEYNTALYLTALALHRWIPLPRFRLLVALFLSGVTSALLVTRFIFFS